MIFAFVDNLTLAVLGIAGIASALYVVLLVVGVVLRFFAKLHDEGSPLKAWTVGLTLLLIIGAGVKTWYYGK